MKFVILFSLLLTSCVLDEDTGDEEIVRLKVHIERMKEDVEILYKMVNHNLIRMHEQKLYTDSIVMNLKDSIDNM
jgi:hypothetical protein